MSEKMETLETLTNERKPLGLCLSGGGAVGFAHIGVLQALLDNGIRPDILSGTSMGAIIAAMYAAGVNPTEMMRLIEEGKLYKVSNLMKLKPGFWKTGFSTHLTVEKVLHELVPSDTFESLVRPLHVCVTNMNTMQWEIKSEGNNLSNWVSASSSIPGVFESVIVDGFHYLDGGILNNLPAQPLAPLCRAIIGVDVLPFQSELNLKRPVNAILASVRGVQKVNSEPGRALCTHLIDVQAIRKFHEFRFEEYQKIYRQGYKDAKEYIRTHPDIINV